MLCMPATHDSSTSVASASASLSFSRQIGITRPLPMHKAAHPPSLLHLHLSSSPPLLLVWCAPCVRFSAWAASWTRTTMGCPAAASEGGRSRAAHCRRTTHNTMLRFLCTPVRAVAHARLATNAIGAGIRRQVVRAFASQVRTTHCATRTPGTHTLQTCVRFVSLCRSRVPSLCPLPLLSPLQPAVTADSVRVARERSAAGIAPIDLSGTIDLQDDPTAGNEDIPTQPESHTRRTGGGGERTARRGADDLRAPPTLPTSTTHLSHALPEANFERLAEKSPWRPATRERSRQDEPEAEAVDPEEAAFESLKPRLPSQGWAASRAAPQQADTASTNATWTDADFLLLFPHLRLARVNSSESPVDGTPEQVAAAVADVRKRIPELEKLHLASTWIKVRKWRELLGATRGPTADAVPDPQSADGGAASTPDLPAGFPDNALHSRYYQADLFMTVDEVSALLIKERGLLYLNIENVVVPRRQSRAGIDPRVL